MSPTSWPSLAWSDGPRPPPTRRAWTSARTRHSAATPPGPDPGPSRLSRCGLGLLVELGQSDSSRDHGSLEPRPFVSPLVEAAAIALDPEVSGKLDQGDVVGQLVGHGGRSPARPDVRRR